MSPARVANPPGTLARTPKMTLFVTSQTTKTGTKPILAVFHGWASPGSYRAANYR